MSNHADNVRVGRFEARRNGTSDVTEVVFLRGSEGTLTGDLHMARIENPQDELAHFICAIIDQGPLLTERRALQASAAALRARHWRLQIEAGVDVPLGGGWLLNADVKKVQIGTKVLADGSSVGRFKVDPLLIGVGIGKRF